MADAIFSPERSLQGQLGRERPSIGQRRLGPLLVHRPGRIGEGNGDEFALVIDLLEPVLDLEAVERALHRGLPIRRSRLPAIFGAGDRLGLVADLGEALAERRRVVGKGLDQRLGEFVMLETVQPDELLPTGAEPELVIAAELVIVAVGDLGHVAEAVGLIGADAGAELLHVLVEDAGGGIDVQDRPVAENALERARQPRLLAIDGQHLFASVDDRAVGRIDDFRTRIAVAETVILDTQRIIEAGRLPADRSFAIGETRLGTAGADLGPPGERAAHAGGRGNDVGDLAGQARHRERRAVDDVDTGDVARRDAAEFGDHVVRLAGETLAVDQHVGGRLSESAAFVLLLDREPRHLAQHVERRLGRESCEILRRVALGSFDGGRSGRDRRRGIAAILRESGSDGRHGARGERDAICPYPGGSDQPQDALLPAVALCCGGKAR